MKIIIGITLLLGVVRAVSDYSVARTNLEKLGVLVIISMFITSMILVYKL